MKRPVQGVTGALRGRDFPGGHAGASLKPGLRRPRPRRRTHFPGGHAGASLKRGADRHGAGRDRGDFPGGHAGASLKLF